MAGRRICAGYYRRYDGRVVYVISLATDADTSEEMVIWTTYPFADVPSQPKILLSFRGGKWGVEGQVQTATEYEDLSGRRRAAGG